MHARAGDLLARARTLSPGLLACKHAPTISFALQSHIGHSVCKFKYSTSEEIERQRDREIERQRDREIER